MGREAHCTGAYVGVQGPFCSWIIGESWESSSSKSNSSNARCHLSAQSCESTSRSLNSTTGSQTVHQGVLTRREAILLSTNALLPCPIFPHCCYFMLLEGRHYLTRAVVPSAPPFGESSAQSREFSVSSQTRPPARQSAAVCLESAQSQRRPFPAHCPRGRIASVWQFPWLDSAAIGPRTLPISTTFSKFAPSIVQRCPRDDVSYLLQSLVDRLHDPIEMPREHLQTARV